MANPRKFSLDSVLRLRKLLSDQALARLGALEQQRAELYRVLRQVEEQQVALTAALGRVQGAAVVDAAEVRRYLARLKAQQQAAGDLLLQIERQDALIALQRIELGQRRMDQEALETLKTRFFERLRVKEQKAETLALEEAAMIRSARERRAS